MMNSLLLYIKNNLHRFGPLILGSISQAVILMGVNIYIGRELGPAQYGQFAYIISISTIFSIPLIFGQQAAMVNYISSKTDSDSRKTFFSNSFVITLVVMSVIVIGAYLLKSVIMDLLHLEASTFPLIIFHSIMLAGIAIFHGIFQSIHKFTLIGAFKALFPLLFAGSIFLLVGGNQSLSPALVIKVRAFSILFILLPFLGYHFYKYLNLKKVSASAINRMIGYGFHSTIIASVVTVTLQADRIIIKNMLEYHELGLYLAYIQSTLIIFQFISVIASLIFFPSFAKLNDIQRRSEIRNLKKKLPFVLVLSILVTPLSYLILELYGSTYEQHLSMILLLNVAGGLIIAHSILSRAVQSFSISGVRRGTINSIINALVYFMSVFVLIKSFGLYGAAGALIIYNISGIFLNMNYLLKWSKKKP